MGCFVNNDGCDACRRRSLIENKPFVEHASLEHGSVTRTTIDQQIDPNSLEVMDDARIVKRGISFEKIERVLDTAQSRPGRTFTAAHPKSVNVSAC